MFYMSNNVYIADLQELEDEYWYYKLLPLMPSYRNKQLEKLKFHKNKIQCLGAGLLLRYALSAYGINPDTASIIQPERRKPYLADYPDVFFNLSHSENRVMCSIGNYENGCDTEMVKPIPQNIAERFFSDSEKTLLQKHSHLPRSEQEKLFFRLWTLKESFIKANGQGMGIALDSFSVSFCDHSSEMVLHNIDDKCYYSREYLTDDGYCYSACTIGDIPADKLTKVSFKDVTFGTHIKL